MLIFICSFESKRPTLFRAPHDLKQYQGLVNITKNSPLIIKPYGNMGLHHMIPSHKFGAANFLGLIFQNHGVSNFPGLRNDNSLPSGSPKKLMFLFSSKQEQQSRGAISLRTNYPLLFQRGGNPFTLKYQQI